MKIAGIDPGTARVGYALIDAGGTRPRLLSAETIAVPPGRGPAERLAAIARALDARLRRDRPDAVALERLSFGKNRKTALAVAETRGVILLTAHGLTPSIWEYAPLEVKVAVAGYGRIGKAEVRRAVRLILGDVSLPAGDDAIDAIAIALTAMATRRFARELHRAKTR